MSTRIPIVILGHKDHGKSTLIGRMLLDSGSVHKGKLEELRDIASESGMPWELAHLLDSFREEREQEMTMDTTRALLKLGKRVYEFIDVPGHRELLAQMITGASNASGAVLVVSAKEGIQAQTLHHLSVARLLGIERVVVVVNKMDAEGFKQKIFERIAAKIRPLLEKNGFGAKSFIPISAASGDNVIKRSAHMPWYGGPLLVGALERFSASPSSSAHTRLRLLVQDTYARGDKTIIAGKMESGDLHVGRRILFTPGNHASGVTEILSSRNVKKAASGESVGILLDRSTGIRRGMVGSTPGARPKVSSVLRAELLWFSAPRASLLTFACGTAEAEGSIGSRRTIRPGKITFHVVKLKTPIAFDTSARTSLGKLAVKERGRVIGIGSIRGERQ